jgi:hypothetical protein
MGRNVNIHADRVKETSPVLVPNVDTHTNVINGIE